VKIESTVIGGDQLVRFLRQLPSEMSVKVQQQALMVAAEPMRDMAASLAPWGTTGPPHLADDIVLQALTIRQLERSEEFFNVDAAVAFGPSRKPNDHFYGFFQEFGTMFHAAHPFMRPAWDQGIGQALRTISEELWKAIRKTLPTNLPGFGARAA